MGIYVFPRTEELHRLLMTGVMPTWKGNIPLDRLLPGVIIGQWKRMLNQQPYQRGANVARYEDMLRVLRAEIERRGLFNDRVGIGLWEGKPCFCGKAGLYREGHSYFCRLHYNRAVAFRKYGLGMKRLRVDRDRQSANIGAADRYMRKVESLKLHRKGPHKSTGR